MSEKIHPAAQQAAAMGRKALHGLKQGQRKAKLASLIPVIGPALGAAVLVGSALVAAFGDDL